MVCVKTIIKVQNIVEQDIVYLKHYVGVSISYEGTLIIKIMSIMWYINIQVLSSSKTHGHVDIQV